LAAPLLPCLALSFALSVGLGTGCEPEESAPTGPPPVAFVGKVDESLVGTWKTENKKSTYDISKDGAYKLEATITTPGGKMDTKSSGQWLVNGDLLLFKDEKGNVAKYLWKLDGKKLTLSLTGSLKRDTVLLRQ
jgi:hypothetical protein